MEDVASTLIEANPEATATMAAVLAETAPGAADNMMNTVADINPEAALAVAGAMAEANPMAAEGTAGAIADTLPDLAADAAGAMAAANPDAAGDIAAGMAAANPEIAGDVAGAMMDAAPEAAQGIAQGIASAAPDQAADVAGAMASVRRTAMLLAAFDVANTRVDPTAVVVDGSVPELVSDACSLSALLQVSAAETPLARRAKTMADALAGGDIEWIVVTPPERAAMDSVTVQVAQGCALGLSVTGVLVAPMPRKRDGWPKKIRRSARGPVSYTHLTLPTNREV